MSTNRWVNWVKKFAADNNLSYGCALSTPECKETYRAKYGVTKKLTKKQNIEKMGAEDMDVPNIKLVVKEKKKRRPTLKLEEVMMEDEDNRSKMVATQEKKKKVLASLPKPKTAPEEPKLAKAKVKLNKITIQQKKYYIDPRNNTLYDSVDSYKKQNKAGIWNAKTETIEKIPSKKSERNMMEAEDIRGKMVATQEKKKKVLASLPKPVETKKISVKRLTVNGVEYLKDGDNILYDSKTKEEIGIWNPVTKTIEEFDDEDEDEED